MKREIDWYKISALLLFAILIGGLLWIEKNNKKPEVGRFTLSEPFILDTHSGAVYKMNLYGRDRDAVLMTKPIVR